MVFLLREAGRAHRVLHRDRVDIAQRQERAALRNMLMNIFAGFDIFARVYGGVQAGGAVHAFIEGELKPLQHLHFEGVVRVCPEHTGSLSVIVPRNVGAPSSQLDRLQLYGMSLDTRLSCSQILICLGASGVQRPK